MQNIELSTSKDNLKNTSDKEKKKKSVRTSLVANVLNTDYEVIRNVLKTVYHCKLSYEYEDEKALTTKDWDLYWNDLIITPEMLSKLKPFQKVNHLPGTEALTRKNLLAKNLNRIKKQFPDEYSFFPHTWLLPADWTDFCKQFDNGKSRTYIVKPEALSKGNGIFLIKHWNQVEPGEHYVVQHYIPHPFLIDGLKFDLRIYVLIYGCDPYRIYIYKEGLARLATEQYVPPKFSNMDNNYIHLTNYAINKDNANFQFNIDAEKADTGNKRSLDFVWKYIETKGGDVALLKERIKQEIVLSFCAVQPSLAHTYRSCQPNDFTNDKCFEILGFDVLIDNKLKPWLLEVNHAPSFTTDTPFDLKVKTELLTDTFRLLHMDPTKRIMYNRKKESILQARLMQVRVERLSKEEKEIKRYYEMIKRDKYEMENLGNFERIYPDEKSNMKYDAYIDASIEQWESFTGGRKRIQSAVNRYKYSNNQGTKDKSGLSNSNTLYPSKSNQKIPNIMPVIKRTPNCTSKGVTTNVYERLSKPNYYHSVKIDTIRAYANDAIEPPLINIHQNYSHHNGLYKFDKGISNTQRIISDEAKIIETNGNFTGRPSTTYKAFNSNPGVCIIPKMVNFIPFISMAQMNWKVNGKRWNQYKGNKATARSPLISY